MGPWGAAVAFFGLLREIMKWVNMREKSKVERRRIVTDLRRAMQKAREQNDTTDIERALRDLGLGVRVDSVKLPNGRPG